MSDFNQRIIPLEKYKHTKIIATVGPSSNSYSLIEALIKAGANGLRLNFSHGDNDEKIQQIKWIREASDKLKKPVAIIQDLQGPKIRLGDFMGEISVSIGEELRFAYMSDHEQTGVIPTQYDLSLKVKRGEKLYLSDGKIICQITSVSKGVVYAKAGNEGVLVKRKSINLPDTDFSGDVITPKDKRDIVFGSTQDIDYVALSFVQSAVEIEMLRKILSNIGSHSKIIAKIETKPAVDNLDEIFHSSDAVMVARGDLALEVPFESVPIIQRKIIGMGQDYAKPTIVATQMLSSMTNSPEPTRAEVSDIATAVLVGSDAVMLSDETASGEYPLEAVKVMKRIILYTEQNTPLRAVFEDHKKETRSHAISEAITNLATNINAVAIVAETKSGATAINISSLRNSIPLIAVTNDPKTAQQLAIVFSVKSFVRPANRLTIDKLTEWLKANKILSKNDIVVTASGKYAGVVGTTDTIKVRMIE